MGLFKLKILSFVSLCKKHRKNSIILNKENRIELSKELGISYNSFKKYYDYCLKHNLLIPYGNHLQFIKLTKTFDILNLNINKHHLFHNWKKYDNNSLKSIYEQIQEQILLLNFKQQQFRIDKKRKEANLVKSIENSKQSHSKKVKSLIKKYGSFSKAQSSISKNYEPNIVSGKFHVSELVGCSSSSSLNLLRRMSKKGIIKRTINFEKLNVAYTHQNFDKQKNEKFFIVPSPKMECFYLSKGSLITLL